MRDKCENPLVDAVINHPVVRAKLDPLRNELQALEAKGVDKTAADRLRIQEITIEVIYYFKKALADAVVIDLGSDCPRPEINPIKRDEMVDLKNLHTDGRTFATCDARMFTTPWSRQFVHGSDSALHIVDLVQKILGPSERIAQLRRITWRKPVTTNLKMAVYDRKFQPGMDMSPYSFDGEIVTSGGSIITFLAMPDEQTRIDLHMAERNPYASLVLCSCPNCRQTSADTSTYRLHELHTSMVQTLDSDPGLKMATLLELLTLAVADNQVQSAREGNDRNLLKLLVGVNGLEFPGSWDDLRGGRLTVELQKNKSRRGKSGMTLIPFEYRFSFMKNPATGLVSATQSVQCAEKILDGCQKGLHQGSDDSRRGGQHRR